MLLLRWNLIQSSFNAIHTFNSLNARLICLIIKLASLGSFNRHLKFKMSKTKSLISTLKPVPLFSILVNDSSILPVIQTQNLESSLTFFLPHFILSPENHGILSSQHIQKQYSPLLLLDILLIGFLHFCHCSQFSILNPKATVISKPSNVFLSHPEQVWLPASSTHFSLTLLQTWLASLWFLEHAKHVPASETLHLPFPLSRKFFLSYPRGLYSYFIQVSTFIISHQRNFPWPFCPKHHLPLITLYNLKIIFPHSTYNNLIYIYMLTCSLSVLPSLEWKLHESKDIFLLW